jgi:hypothetical protein
MERNSMINIEDVVRREDALKNTACRLTRKNSIGPVATPSVLTVVVMLLLTNTILLFDGKAFTKKGTIYSASQTSKVSNTWEERNSSISLPVCSSVKRFSLSKDVFLNICIKQKNIYAVILRNNEQNTTTEGIQLNRTQLVNLKKYMRHIDFSSTKKKTVES